MIARRYVIASAVALIAAAGLGFGAAQFIASRSAAPAHEEEGEEHEEHGATDLVPLKLADAAAVRTSCCPDV